MCFWSKLRDIQLEAIKHYSFAISFYDKASREKNHATNTHMKNACLHRAQMIASLGLENSGQVKKIIDMANKEVSNLVNNSADNYITQNPVNNGIIMPLSKTEFYDFIVKDLEKTDVAKKQSSIYYNLRGKARARNEHYDEAFEDFGKCINKEPDNIGVYFNRFWYGFKSKLFSKSNVKTKDIINDLKNGSKNMLLSIPRFVEYNVLQSKTLNSKTFVFGVGAVLTITGIASFASGVGVAAGLPLLGLGIPIIANYVNNSFKKHPSSARKDREYLGFDHVLFDRDYVDELLFKIQSCEKTLNFDNDFKNRLDTATARYNTINKKIVELDTQISTTNLDTKDLRSLIDSVVRLKEGISESKQKAEILYNQVYHREISQPTILLNKIKDIKEDVLKKLQSEIAQEKDNNRVPTETFENFSLLRQELSKIDMDKVSRDLQNNLDSFTMYKNKINDWHNKIDNLRKSLASATKKPIDKSWMTKVFYDKKNNSRKKNDPEIGRLS